MKPDFSKGLIPAIIQNYLTGEVLMLAYMNEQAYQKTLETKLVTFFSRSRNELWVKGETSGNYLDLISVHLDCDADTILIKAKPRGPACHLGSSNCFTAHANFLSELESVIADRQKTDSQKSYVKSLFEAGSAKIAQKVGEEATEVVIEAMKRDKELLKEESADLIFHFLILLKDNNLNFSDVLTVLAARHHKTK